MVVGIFWRLGVGVCSGLVVSVEGGGCFREDGGGNLGK